MQTGHCGNVTTAALIKRLRHEKINKKSISKNIIMSEKRENKDEKLNILQPNNFVMIQSVVFF